MKQEFWPTIIETIYPPRVKATIDGVPVGYRIGHHGVYSSAKVVTTPKDFPAFTKKVNDWFSDKNSVPAVQIFNKTIKTTTLKRSGWLPSTISNAGLYSKILTEDLDAGDKVYVSPAHPQDTPGKPIAGGTIVAKLRNADDTKVLGTALGVLAHVDGNPHNTIMCIRDVYVEPQARGKHNATEIVNALCRWGYNQGARIAVVDLLVDNHPSVKLFTSCGFVKICEYEFWEYNKNMS